MTDEEQYKLAMDEVFEYEKSISDHNYKILRKLGKKAKEEVAEMMEYCFITDKMKIVDKPSGTKQHEDYKFFKKVFCDQWSVGMEGDSYAGDWYGKIKNGKWLKIPYSC